MLMQRHTRVYVYDLLCNLDVQRTLYVLSMSTSHNQVTIVQTGGSKTACLLTYRYSTCKAEDIIVADVVERKDT